MIVDNSTIPGCLSDFSPSSCGPVGQFNPKLVRKVIASTMQKRGRPYAEKTVTGITFTRHYRLQVKKLCCENCNLKEVLSLSLHLVGNQLAYKAIRKLTSSLPFLMVLLVLQSASCLTSLEKSCPCGN